MELTRQAAIAQITRAEHALLAPSDRRGLLESVQQEDWSEDPGWVELRPEVRTELGGAFVHPALSERYDPVRLMVLAHGYRGATNGFLRSRLLAIGVSCNRVLGEPLLLVPCPICRCRTLNSLGDWDVCPVCWWEDSHLAFRSRLEEARLGWREIGLSRTGRPDLHALAQPPERYLSVPFGVNLDLRAQLCTVDDAVGLVRILGGCAHLVQHHRLVAEVAEELCTGLLTAGLERFKRHEVVLGAALHDVGKIRHPEEMYGPGSTHEQEGHAMLLERGVEERIARHAWTHASWMGQSELEPLLVALADKLWKGRRVDVLEQKAIEALATANGRDFWDVWEATVSVFDLVAAGGEDRLIRSTG